MASPALERRERTALALQREVGRLLSPLWVPLAAVGMWLCGWRFEGVRQARREYRRLRAQPGPVLICANHLTMVDSLVIGAALGNPFWYLTHYRSLAWNVPEATIFQATWLRRFAIWLAKCLPIERGRDRTAIAGVLGRIRFLLERGETVLIFPEGGRSRTGRVDVEASTYAVGRIVRTLPGCRVLCVYVRGDGQDAYTDLPARGERFRVSTFSFEPKTDLRGLRGAVDLSQQVLTHLARLEEEHFRARQ